MKRPFSYLHAQPGSVCGQVVDVCPLFSIFSFYFGLYQLLRETLSSVAVKYSTLFTRESQKVSMCFLVMSSYRLQGISL